MHRRRLLSYLPLLSLAAFTAHGQLRQDGATASFRGALPPKPVAALSADQEAVIEKELAAVTQAFAKVKTHRRAADAHIFIKAVRYALDFDEWYDKKPEDGLKKALALLAEARQRIASLQTNQTPWMDGPGQKVLGFYSKIDDSPQPYGVEIPQGLQWGPSRKPVPMWIWLHGRGDTATDLHFVYGKLTAKEPGQFQPKAAIVIHPFGRYCNGWKSAGETDVFEARDDAAGRFNVDTNRIALAGFSMGGAGAWHIGAHYADQWACVHAGAGFVDVKRYLKLTPEKMPVWYEKVLWGIYDVPYYARNFFNVPLVVYSGENDAQRDAAEYMMEVLDREGLKPPHLIGPGMGHKYHPQVIKEVQTLIEEAVAKGRDPMPKKVVLQTRSARYTKMHWLHLEAAEQPWEEARIDAEVVSEKLINVKTKGVSSFSIANLKPSLVGMTADVDGQQLKLEKGAERIVTFTKEERTWFVDADSARLNAGHNLIKAGGTCIGDVFLDSFIFILPDGPCASPAVDQWVKAESQHAIDRWRSLMRGDPRVMTAAQFKKLAATRSLPAFTDLILWGDAQSNSLIADFLARGGSPLVWKDGQVSIADQTYPAATHVPLLIYPNLAIEFLQQEKALPHGGRVEVKRGGSIVINSGLTFREAHDRTNSLQNPKLPDWAILDITTPPTAEAAGKVVAADFFDAHWRVREKDAPRGQRPTN